MPLLLELFSGTGSIGKAFKELGWEVVSLDCNPKANATITCDILDWEPPPGLKPDHVHASPPCTEYSIAKTTGLRDLELADRIARKTLDIIADLRPRTFTIENPWTGMMKGREFMRDLNHQMQVVTYCRYGLQYKKSTAIWTNLLDWTPRPLCTKADPCPNVVNGRHAFTAQRGPCRKSLGDTRDVFSRDQLYRIPAELCRELALAATSIHTTERSEEWTV
jgi:hypothetical protein